MAKRGNLYYERTASRYRSWETNLARRRLRVSRVGPTCLCVTRGKLIWRGGDSSVESWANMFVTRGKLIWRGGDSTLHRHCQRVCELADYYSLSEFEPDLRRQLAEVLDLLFRCSLRWSRYMMALQGHVLKCKQARICKLCKSMTRFVKFHAGMCKLSYCGVRRCMEIRKHNLEKAHRREHRRKERELRKQMHLMTITQGAKGKEQRELTEHTHLLTITQDGAIHMI